MALPELSNEQKLTYVYLSLKAEDERRRRGKWYGLIKLIIIIGIIYIVFTYPKQVSSIIGSIIGPIIQEQVDSIKNSYQENLKKSIQDVLPPSVSLSRNNQTSPQRASTGTTATKK